MSVDTGLRFGRYNSYELAAGEELWSSKFDVELYGQIAVQLQAIRPANTATGQLIVRWIKADGGKLSDDTKSISVATRWTRETWILTVPTGAVKAMWAVKNTHASRAWNFACGMVEPGPVAGAFDPALANQVSLLTASGLYTGTVTADQVETGLLQATDGRAWFDLDKPEIVMEGDTATWKASPENPLRLEDGEGGLIGGLVRLLDGELANLAGVLTNKEEADFYLMPGTFERDGKEFNGIIGVRKDSGPAFEIGSTYAREEVWYNTPMLSIRAIPYPRPGGGLIPYVSIRLQDETSQRPGDWSSPSGGWATIFMDPHYINMYVKNNAGPDFELGSWLEKDAVNKFSLSTGGGADVSGNEATVSMKSGTHALGVDATGPYRIKNGTKTYF